MYQFDKLLKQLEEIHQQLKDKRELDRNFTPSKYSDQDYLPQLSEKRYKKRISTVHNIIQFPLEVIKSFKNVVLYLLTRKH